MSNNGVFRGCSCSNRRAQRGVDKLMTAFTLIEPIIPPIVGFLNSLLKLP